MKIQVENVPDNWDELNKFLEYAVKCYTLYELRLMQGPKPIGKSLLIGFGSSHCWVSRKSDGKRILLITNG